MIEDLKMCKLSDTEERNKMVQILKQNVKELERESILPGDDTDSESENEQNSNEKSVVDDRQLIQAYEKEIGNWNPWWRKEKSILEEICLDQFNPKLLQNSQTLNVLNASSLISCDIIQLFYIYSVIAGVYQLEEVMDPKENNLNEEVVLNLLQFDKLCKTAIPQQANLNIKINLTFKLLLEEQSLFLRDYISKSFLLNLLDDIDCLKKHSLVIYKLFSTLYDSFQIFTKSKKLSKKIPELIDEKENKEEEEINVFHFNKNFNKNKPQYVRTKKSRVEIVTNLTTKTTTTTHQVTSNKLVKSETCLKEAKVFMKRLEFYFRWFQLNNLTISNSLEDFSLIRDKLINEYQQLAEEKEFMQKNLTKLRAQIKQTNTKALIEEI